MWNRVKVELPAESAVRGRPCPGGELARGAAGPSRYMCRGGDKIGPALQVEVGGRDSRGNAWRRDTQQPLWLQGSIFEECHLGIELTDSKHCLEEYEARLRKKAVTTSRAPWAFSCYEGDGALWELVAVPGLAFGNAVLAFHRLLGGHWRSGSERPAVLHWACTCTSRPCRATWAGHRPR